MTSVHDFQPSSNYDELFMQQRSLFADSLKDMRNIRKQLYSAAEYFESQYRRDDREDQLFMESLNDYVAQALISTVDHLGSVAFKVNNVLDQNIKEVSETNLRCSRIEQRLQTCQVYTGRMGLREQSLVIETPKHQKHYLLPGDHFAGAIEAIQEKPESTFSRLASGETPSSPSTFSFTTASTKEQLGKRSNSPLRFPLKRSGSVGRSVSPSFPIKGMGSVTNRSISPNSFNSRQRFRSEPRSSDQLYIHPERDRTKEIEIYSQKTKSLLKALLSIHKSKKDSKLYS